MAWISVYQEVDGPKLRKLYRELKTSKAEALGILNFLWFWGMNNADETGRVLEGDRRDIEDMLSPVTDIPPEKVVNALFASKWLDEIAGNVYLHDWSVWQEQWFKVQKKRKSDAERVRRYRSNIKSVFTAVPNEVKQKEPSLPTLPSKSELSDTKEVTSEKKDKSKSKDKKEYAEFVHLTEIEYKKLISSYGKEFTEVCIEKLDNYKGSKNKSYKDDYRAILSWVIEECKKQYPGLLQKSRNESDNFSFDCNPFDEVKKNE